MHDPALRLRQNRLEEARVIGASILTTILLLFMFITTADFYILGILSSIPAILAFLFVYRCRQSVTKLELRLAAVVFASELIIFVAGYACPALFGTIFGPGFNAFGYSVGLCAPASIMAYIAAVCTTYVLVARLRAAENPT